MRLVHVFLTGLKGEYIMDNSTLEYNSRCFVRELVREGKDMDEIIEELSEFDDFRDLPKSLRHKVVMYADEIIEPSKSKEFFRMFSDD